MRYPSRKKLVPLALKHINNTGLKVLASGKVSNGKKGLNRFTMPSIYKYGILLYQAGLIERRGMRYSFKSMLCGVMPYPFKTPLDLRETL